MTMKLSPAALIITLTLCIISACTEPTIRLGTTTTLEDSGLLPLLLQAFEQQHDITIKPIIAGSGQIHTLIRNGNIDSAITHDPRGEQQLFAENQITQRRPLMKNDFIIVGPTSDDAHISYSLTADEAFKKIINAGALFVSRSDHSGTHQAEANIWQRIQRQPRPEHAIRTGSGMGASLAVAAERGAYTLVDRGTWENFANKQSLQLLFENADLLPNVYSLLSFKQSAVVKRWERWLFSDTARALIDNYRRNNRPVFFTLQPD
ncbi:MAG: substrate-binding domain-containing protein [Cellvibrionaceae bacterium]|nr:substrate-binding domain-containing protein [Cellvibrionaceae bacterium]